MLTLYTREQATQWLRAHVKGTLVTDSRQVRPGDGFVAWPGTAVDARQFVQVAQAQGASACLVEQDRAASFKLEGLAIAAYPELKAETGEIAAAFFNHPSAELAVVAVTGTNGKTSTTWWLAQALSNLGATSQPMPCGVIGTLGVGRPGAAPGAPDEVRATGFTTPDPVVLQRTLRQFADQGLRACAMEASSIGIAEERMAGTQVRVAVFTNFTQDHLDYHGSMGDYWQAKRRLFAWTGLRAAVVNTDDTQGVALASELADTGVEVWTVSALGGARLHASNIVHETQGLRFDVVEGAEVCTLRSHVIGGYNVSNLLCVVASMRALGVPLQAAVAACAALKPVPGRMEMVCVPSADVPLVAVDYAHTPDALAQALAALRPLVQQRGGQLWCVFGCGGDRDNAKRPLMGAIAAQKADRVVVTSDNPRSEKPEAIIAQILLGVAHGPHVEVQADRAQAIAQAVAHAHAGDVILLAGKGHEQEQIIAGVKHPFSDQAHALQALQARAAQSGSAPV